MKNMWSKLVRLVAAAFAAALLIGGVPGYAGSVPVYAEECANSGQEENVDVRTDGDEDSVSIETGTQITWQGSGEASPCVDEKRKKPGDD